MIQSQIGSSDELSGLSGEESH